MHTEFPFPLSSDHQRDIYSAIFASTVFPAPAWHAWSPDFQLAQRASGHYSTGSTEPAYLPTRNAGERDFKGFWILRTPLVTTVSSCNDPSDSAEAPFLLQKSVAIC